MALNGYVPSAASGVTIGFGVDLGQLSVATLERYKVDPSIIKELEAWPWIGKKGSQAQAELDAHMLTLSVTDATTLSNEVFQGVYNDIKTNFDNNNELTFYTFEQLPAGVQTALTDMEYNNGNIWDAASALVRQAANDAEDGDWSGVVQELGALAKTNTRYKDDKTDVQNAIDEHLIPAKANLDNGHGGECP